MTEIDHLHKLEVVCPNCGHKHRDSWDMKDGHQYECEAECGAEFIVAIDILYTTYPITPPEDKP